MSRAKPGPPPPARPLRVLVVDDNADGRRALARFLSLKGFEISDRPDGTSALEALRDGPRPDVVLTDLMLPDMDGRQVSWHAHQLIPGVHVALITGWSVELRPLDQQRWGFDEIFIKPLDIQALLDYLRAIEPAPRLPDTGT